MPETFSHTDVERIEREARQLRAQLVAQTFKSLASWMKKQITVQAAGKGQTA